MAYLYTFHFFSSQMIAILLVLLLLQAGAMYPPVLYPRPRSRVQYCRTHSDCAIGQRCNYAIFFGAGYGVCTPIQGFPKLPMPQRLKG